MYRKICLLVVALLSNSAAAELPGVLSWEVGRNIEITYNELYKSLENNKFFVVFEPNIGRNLAGFAARWGEDYNRNGLRGIRSMVFCNAWYANQVSNREPDLLALCPLHVTLYQRGDTTHVVFIRPTHVGDNSDAMPLLQELEQAVSKAIQAGVDAAAR
ncbi:MAG: DUF302 domain-containing protein [Pseudomonadota bacterium]